MDLQSLLTNLFTILALALPVFLILAHTQREGWKLSPPVYAGIVGMLASFAMMARQSGFLESQIAEVSTGWFTSDMIIAMILAFLAAMNLAVFDWIVPGLRLRLESIPESLKTYLRQSAKRKDGLAFDIAGEDISDEPGLPRTMLAISWAVLSSVLLLIALGVYLWWPAWFLTIESHQKELLEANKNVEMTLSQQNQRNLIARATNVGAMTNELVQHLERRVDYCKHDLCVAWTRKLNAKVIAEVEAYGFRPKGGAFPVAEFPRRLDTWDMVKSMQSRLTEIAKNRGVKLQAAKRPEASLEEKRRTLETDAVAIAEKNAASNSRLVDKLLSVISDPRDALAAMTNSTLTTIAIAMECAAIILAFFSGAARRQCAN
jgi:hypothetical protein